SLYVDRSVSADDSEPDIESLVKNLKNVIMKKLFISYVIRSLISLFISSITSFSAASLSVSFFITLQSSTLTSVSDSLTPAISVSVIPGFTVSAFITSSLCFKKILYRLNESHLSA
ncbi:hypothetical protein BDFG_06653, partial [Blastomyces dermatitidis ATCC 26199]